jgi:hypothetical protein
MICSPCVVAYYCNTDRKCVLLLQPCHELREKRSHVDGESTVGILDRFEMALACFGVSLWKIKLEA